MFRSTATGFLFVAILGSLLAGCAVRSTHHSTSIVQYLYPDEKEHIESARVPALSLPLRVGIAFVPETSSNPSGLTEGHKMELMKEVRSHFEACEFVKAIEMVPSAYLRPNGGFANLDQIGRMFDIDVIALISYDQVQFTDEGLATLTYWTLIGAYIIPGEKNDTHTLMDAAVYDISSRVMLFRAPGVSHVKSRAALIDQSRKTREDQLEGFKAASTTLIANLDEELARFREKVKESPEEIRITHKPGYTGGGDVGGLLAAFVVLIGGMHAWRRRRGCPEEGR